MNEIKPTSDPIYKRLYSFPEMVADLLRSLLPGKMVEGMDMGSLEKMSAEYVGDDFRKRHGDTVWRVRADGAAGGWAYALVLVEYLCCKWSFEVASLAGHASSGAFGVHAGAGSGGPMPALGWRLAEAPEDGGWPFGPWLRSPRLPSPTPEVRPASSAGSGSGVLCWPPALGVQSRSSRSRTLASRSSLRMTATRATFPGLPSATSCRCLAAMSGLQRTALIAAM